MARVTSAAVGNWRARFPDFPRPTAVLAAGPVFERDRVRAWLRKRRVPMATVISMINLKGGVGKTTTTVAVAQMLDGEFQKRVLVVDLDPQTNATVMLLGDKEWGKLNAQGRTVAQIFRDALDPENKKFEIEKSIQRGVGNVGDVRRLALLPSSIDLIEIQDELASMGRGRFHAASPIDLLRRAIRPVLDEFDFVLIDCPPSLGIVTLNGLRISHGYVIPTIPDILSTYGIPQIVRRVREFSDNIQEEIEPYGIAVTMYREQSTVHRNQLKLLRQGKDAPVFDTLIPVSNDLSGAAEYVDDKPVSTLRQKWGYRGTFDAYRALAAEVMKKAQVPA